MQRADWDEAIDVRHGEITSAEWQQSTLNSTTLMFNSERDYENRERNVVGLDVLRCVRHAHAAVQTADRRLTVEGADSRLSVTSFFNNIVYSSPAGRTPGVSRVLPCWLLATVVQHSFLRLSVIFSLTKIYLHKPYFSNVNIYCFNNLLKIDSEQVLLPID